MKVKISFILGLLVGTVWGALYAPHKGKVTRKLIRNRIDESREAARERLEEMKSGVDEA